MALLENLEAGWFGGGRCCTWGIALILLAIIVVIVFCSCWGFWC